MKKNLLSFLLCLISFTTFSQEEETKVFEGFNGFPWGTTVEEIKKTKIITMSNNDAIEEKLEITHYNEINSTGDEIRVYSFKSNELFAGEIIYINPDSYKIKAITSKIIKTYGYLIETAERADFFMGQPCKKYNCRKDINKNFTISLTLISETETGKIEFVQLSFWNPTITDQIIELSKQFYEEELSF